MLRRTGPVPPGKIENTIIRAEHEGTQVKKGGEACRNKNVEPAVQNVEEIILEQAFAQR